LTYFETAHFKPHTSALSTAFIILRPEEIDSEERQSSYMISRIVNYLKILFKKRR
jgi:hypothetical protein